MLLEVRRYLHCDTLPEMTGVIWRRGSYIRKRMLSQVGDVMGKLFEVGDVT